MNLVSAATDVAGENKVLQTNPVNCILDNCIIYFIA